MTIALSLDRDALEALFPEGSEVRVQLRGAVIDQIVRRYGQKDWPAIQQECKRATDIAFQEALKASGFRHNGYNTLQLQVSEEIKLQMRQRAKEQIQLEISESMDLSPERIRLLRDDLLQQLGLRIQQELSGEFQAHIERTVTETMRKFLAVTFNPMALQGITGNPAR